MIDANFTPIKKANPQIQKYLQVIVDTIVSQIPQTQSIILAGGFGRGEGSVIIKNKQAIPLNDFDIYIITNQAIDEHHLNHVANLA